MQPDPSLLSLSEPLGPISSFSYNTVSLRQFQKMSEIYKRHENAKDGYDTSFLYINDFYKVILGTKD